MSQHPILINRDHPQITILTLNRPEKRNALNLELLNELLKALQETKLDKSRRVLILQGNGSIFCAGLDLSEAANLDHAENSAKLIAEILKTLCTLPLVTIALVQGAAIAGGAGLMAACDFAVAADGTSLGFPETHRGLIAALVMTLLRRQLRDRDVRELLFLGELIDAERARAIGLINRGVPQQQLQECGLQIAEKVLKGAPEATIKTKLLLEEFQPTSFEEDLRKAILYHHAARHSEEAKEGIRAFLEHREPRWI